MALQILECNGTFYLKGALNVTTYTPFITRFEQVFKNTQDVTINIDQVKEIDRNGVNAFKIIYTSAQNDNKEFSITGYGCKDIYDEFRYEQIA